MRSATHEGKEPSSRSSRLRTCVHRHEHSEYLSRGKNCICIWECQIFLEFWNVYFKSLVHWTLSAFYMILHCENHTRISTTGTMEIGEGIMLHSNKTSSWLWLIIQLQ